MLTATEEALLRGWIQGVSWKSLAETYLDEADSVAVIRILRGLRQRLAAKARLVRPETAPFWVNERGYTLIWQDRALLLLFESQSLPDPIPSLEDPVTAWLPPNPAQRLNKHGISTVEKLTDYLEMHGTGWWRTLPGIGRTTALAIAAWYRDHLSDLDLPRVPGVTPLPRPALTVRSSGVAPLERFAPPPALEGQNGQNRAPPSRCKLPVENDVQAVLAWLAGWDPKSPTFRAYRKEAERFLLWAVCAQQTPISSLTTLHCAGYRRFLQNPAPGERWVGPSAPRWSPNWRPFLGALSPRSQRYAENILSALCQWLVDQGYLETNPFTGLHRPRRPAEKVAVDRSFSPTQWRQLLDYAEQQIERFNTTAEDPIHRRNAFILKFAYGTGLRLHELAQASIEQLTEHEEQWWLQVFGKGHKRRTVPIPPNLFLEIEGSLNDRGLPQIRQARPETPLIGRVRGDSLTPLTPSGLHQVVQSFFQQAAQDFQRLDPILAQRLLKSSTHWLRHTHGSHAAASNLPLPMIRDTLGHANLSTTSLYTHSDDDARYAAYRELFEQQNRRGEEKSQAAMYNERS